MPTMATDPLSLLRQYNIDKEEIVEENDKIIMGEHSWPKDVPTYFLEFGYVGWNCLPVLINFKRNLDFIHCLIYICSSSTGKDGKLKKYYTLETLLFFLKNKSLKHPEYIKQAVVR